MLQKPEELVRRLIVPRPLHPLIPDLRIEKKLRCQRKLHLLQPSVGALDPTQEGDSRLRVWNHVPSAGRRRLPGRLGHAPSIGKSPEIRQRYRVGTTEGRAGLRVAGEVVPGSGGVRKLRWKRADTGKRGGLRVIYFVRYQPGELWLLTLYAKARQKNIPGHILRQLKEVFEHE